MSTDAVAIVGFLALFALMLLRVPVGMAMGLVGVSGFGYLVGGTPALKLVGQTSMRTVTDYTFGVIPMFLLMGTFVSNSGMSRELFKAANGFVGHLRGGLGFATVVACGGFAAICGSSVATAATFSAVATFPLVICASLKTETLTLRPPPQIGFAHTLALNTPTANPNQKLSRNVLRFMALTSVVTAKARPVGELPQCRQDAVSLICG